MIAPATKVQPPSDDKRWKIVDATMRRNGYDRDGLIEALHTVQESFGCLDQAGLKWVAHSLRCPMSSVYGVATFYHFFTLKPAGKHSCTVCTGTACYIKGAAQLLDLMKSKYNLKPGETSADGQLSLLMARCLGSCGLAPAVVFDNEVSGKVDLPKLNAKLEGWLKS